MEKFLTRVFIIPLNRLVSILLLLIFLFNVGGYYLVFIGLRHRSDFLLSKKIERNQYNEDETIELKIPVTLPYPLQQNGFERVDGKFEHQGTFYKLIKQKLENDTIYIVCIRDLESKQIANSFKDYVAKTNDLPVNSKNTLNFFGKFLKDFEAVENDLIQHSNGWTLEIQFADLTFPPHAALIIPPGQPPKA
jgi:hypothetical protein